MEEDDSALLAEAIVNRHRQNGHNAFIPPPHAHTRQPPRAEPPRHRPTMAEYPHETEYSRGVLGSMHDALTGAPAVVHPQFRIRGVDTSVVDVSLFAHHESALDDVMTWQYLFTLCMLAMAVVIGALATLVVAGIVTSYNNGVMFLLVAIFASVLIVLQFGALLRDWARYSPFSHIHNNAVLLPAMYFMLAFVAALVALGYWVQKYQADFFDSYDPSAAPPAELPYYYGVYALLAALSISAVPELLASATAQRYPERKLNLYRESNQSYLYYVTDDPGTGLEVRLCE